MRTVHAKVKKRILLLYYAEGQVKFKTVVAQLAVVHLDQVETSGDTHSPVEKEVISVLDVMINGTCQESAHTEINPGLEHFRCFPCQFRITRNRYAKGRLVVQVTDRNIAVCGVITQALLVTL